LAFVKELKMIVDRTDGHLEGVKSAAKKMGKLEQLEKELGYLGNYAQHDGRETRCLLYKDFAPLSFAFTMEVRSPENPEWARWFNGGLIFHGEVDGYGSGKAPTYSVTLNPTDGWSVHT
jgi:hypothetical protein